MGCRAPARRTRARRRGPSPRGGDPTPRSDSSLPSGGGELVCHSTPGPAQPARPRVGRRPRNRPGGDRRSQNTFCDALPGEQHKKLRICGACAAWRGRLLPPASPAIFDVRSEVTTKPRSTLRSAPLFHARIPGPNLEKSPSGVRSRDSAASPVGGGRSAGQRPVRKRSPRAMGSAGARIRSGGAAGGG